MATREEIIAAIDAAATDDLPLLATKIATEIQERANAAATEGQVLRDGLTPVIDRLNEKLGPETTTKGVRSINEIRNYTPAEMASGSGLGLTLAFDLIETLTVAVRDLAIIERANND